MKTCPCNVYPLEPHFYIAKLGYPGVYLFFLFLLQNIDCGYLLEPPHLGGSNVLFLSNCDLHNKKDNFTGQTKSLRDFSLFVIHCWIA